MAKTGEAAARHLLEALLVETVLERVPHPELTPDNRLRYTGYVSEYLTEHKAAVEAAFESERERAKGGTYDPEAVYEALVGEVLANAPGDLKERASELYATPPPKGI